VYAVLAVTLIVCATNWWACWRNDHRLEAITKPVATVGSIAVALTAGGPSDATFAAVVALALCLAGDVALLPQVNQFLVGLGAFLVAHLAFLGMFAILGFEKWWWVGPGLIFVTIVLASAAVPILRHSAAKGMGAPVRMYLGVISVMCVFGWATGNVLVAVGVTAFVVSDTILGFRRFVLERAWQQPAIMVTYHAALLCLAASLALA
jgi:uncharacterized membrane protein YhhN